MDKPLIVENLTKTFKSSSWFKKPIYFTAVNDISFELRNGEILGLLGPNGAGKTTTLQMLLGLLNPTSGKISYFGKDLNLYAQKIMQEVTFASSYLKLPESLTVQENLNLYAKLYSIPKDIRKDKIEKNIDFFGLTQVRKRLTKTLSAGQLTRLMLAKAFLPNPKIVLLDEPTAALDPDIANQIRKFILEEQKQNKTSIILTSHNMSEVEELCDRIIFLKEGKILSAETPKSLVSKIKISRVNFNISKNLEKLLDYINQNNLIYVLNDKNIEISIDEQKIADLLYFMMNQEIKYNEISIAKPNLQDYFLEMSK